MTHSFIVALIVLVVSLGAGVIFNFSIAKKINKSNFYNSISDKTLNNVGLFACAFLYLAIWGQIYLNFSQKLFILLYAPSCAVMAFCLVRAVDKGGAGSLILNISFAIMTALGLLLKV